MIIQHVMSVMDIMALVLGNQSASLAMLFYSLIFHHIFQLPTSVLKKQMMVILAMMNLRISTTALKGGYIEHVHYQLGGIIGTR